MKGAIFFGTICRNSMLAILHPPPSSGVQAPWSDSAAVESASSHDGGGCAVILRQGRGARRYPIPAEVSGCPASGGPRAGAARIEKDTDPTDRSPDPGRSAFLSDICSRSVEGLSPMLELDAESLVDQATMLGLVSRQQLHEATADAEDGSSDTALRMLLRKGLLTSWQVDRLKKGDPSGFFYGEAKVLFHLAEGTFARVYRAEHVGSGQPLAVKVLRQRFAQIPEAVQRFHKEAEAGMRLSHPNIVRIIDVGQQENRHFMIMEYVEGMNLRDFLKLRVRMKGHQSLPLMLGLAEGLKYSQEQGITHRDIKGTNILVSNTGVAKLVDFGLATIEGDENKQGVKSQRTVDYSALERTCKSPKGDPRSDIYFLGCVFYQMVTGQLPMEEAESKD